jgi:hypothetical protein
VDRSVELYLASRASASAQVVFSADAEKEVQLLSVGLTDERGAPIDAPTRDQPFGVRLRYAVRATTRGLDVGVRLTTSRGVRVLDETWSDSTAGVAHTAGKGTWEISLIVPPVLAAEEYTVGVSIGSPFDRFVDEEVLTFRLLPHPTDRREAIERRRIVQAPVTWRQRQEKLG